MYLYRRDNAIRHNLGAFVHARVLVPALSRQQRNVFLVPEGRDGAAHEDADECEDDCY
jgi:hypothetical protein